MRMKFKMVLLIVLSLLLFSSCGKEKVVEKKTVYNNKEYVLENGNIPVKTALTDSTVYYVSKINLQDNNVEKVMVYDINKKSEKELPIAFLNEEKILSLHYSNSDTLVIMTCQIKNEKSTFWLSAYDKEGKKLWKNDVTDFLKDKDLETSYYLETDKNGYIYLLDGLYYVCVWNEKGEFKFNLRNEKWMSSISCINGEVWVWAKDSEENYLQEINFEKQKWKDIKTKTLPDVTGLNGCIFEEHISGDFLINSGSSLVSYNKEKGTVKKILDWTEYGMSADSIYEWKVEGEQILCITSNLDNVKMVILSPAAEGEIVEKKIITINDDGTHGYIEKAISKFNQENEKYTVQLVEGKGDAVQRVSLRNAEIAAGRGTDIICMESENQYRNYANKGILEDLYNYMDKDIDIQKEDFLPNICMAYEQNGKLCGLPPSFCIYSMAAPTKYVGEKIGLTFEEFKEITSNLPENMKLSPIFLDKKIVFRYLLSYTCSQFIDFENHTCNFESDEFIEWITYIDSIKLEDNFDDISKFDTSQINMKDYLLSPEVVSSEWAYQIGRIYFGEEEITFIGYPGNGECGSYIGNTTVLGIWSESSNKEGAWEFIKFLLAEEQQDALKEGDAPAFPVRMSNIEKNFAKAMEPEYENDEKGKQVEIPKGEATLISGEKVPYYAATKEDMDKMRDLVTSVNMIYSGYFNEGIDNIVMEEIAAFYEGDKSAKEVAGLIQNRIELYLNEIK